jgi:D-aminoacyl-tRNA deacylase
MVYLSLHNKRILLVSSTQDIASTNMKNVILEHFGYKEKEIYNEYTIYRINEKVDLFLTNNSLLDLNFLDKQLSYDFIVFLSKHKSENNLPGIYIHPIGNFSNSAPLGGLPNKLSYVSAIFMKVIFLKLREIVNMNVGLEATHHGPYIEKTPSLFLEIGSSEEQWANRELAYAVIKKLFESIDLKENFKYEPVVCFGGPHYAPAFLNYEISNEFAIGHIISKYSLQNTKKIDKQILIEPIIKTFEKVDKVMVDWKGVKSNIRQLIVELLKEYEIIKV